MSQTAIRLPFIATVPILTVSKWLNTVDCKLALVLPKSDQVVKVRGEDYALW